MFEPGANNRGIRCELWQLRHAAHHPAHSSEQNIGTSLAKNYIYMKSTGY